jgi:hypothetical protein
MASVSVEIGCDTGELRRTCGQWCHHRIEKAGICRLRLRSHHASSQARCWYQAIMRQNKVLAAEFRREFCGMLQSSRRGRNPARRTVCLGGMPLEEARKAARSHNVAGAGSVRCSETMWTHSEYIHGTDKVRRRYRVCSAVLAAINSRTYTVHDRTGMIGKNVRCIENGRLHTCTDVARCLAYSTGI